MNPRPVDPVVRLTMTAATCALAASVRTHVVIQTPTTQVLVTPRSRHSARQTMTVNTAAFAGTEPAPKVAKPTTIAVVRSFVSLEPVRRMHVVTTPIAPKERSVRNLGRLVQQAVVVTPIVATATFVSMLHVKSEAKPVAPTTNVHSAPFV